MWLCTTLHVAFSCYDHIMVKRQIPISTSKSTTIEPLQYRVRDPLGTRGVVVFCFCCMWLAPGGPAPSCISRWRSLMHFAQGAHHALLHHVPACIYPLYNGSLCNGSPALCLPVCAPEKTLNPPLCGPREREDLSANPTPAAGFKLGQPTVPTLLW
jgi:hypothetical protein